MVLVVSVITGDCQSDISVTTPSAVDMDSPRPCTSSSNQDRTPVTAGNKSVAIRRSCTGDSWAESFQIPWRKLSSKIQKAITAKKRICPAEKRAMVRSLVDDMRQFDPNPRLEHVKIVARRIVSSYPDTFEDRTDEGERLGNGSYSLAMKLKTRIDHVNRNNSVVKIRQVRRRLHSRPDAANDSASTDEPKKRQPSDRYGCIAWQPEELPSGETYDTLDDKKTQLMNIFARDGPSTCSVGEVDELMKVTFVLQRRSINADPPPPLSELQHEWPYLFTPRWMCSHFCQLVGTSVISTMQDSMEKKGKRIVRFLESDSFAAKGKVKEVLLQYHETMHAQESGHDILSPTVMLLLLAYFKEEETALFQLTDVSNNCNKCKKTAVYTKVNGE